MSALALSTPHSHHRSLSSHNHRTPAQPNNSSHSANPSSSTPAMATSSPLSLSDTLPSVDFGFEDLKKQMSAFTARFDEFIEKGRKRVLEERREFRGALGSVEETQSSHLKSLTHLQSLLTSHQSTLTSQTHERNNLLNEISSISTRQTTLLSNRDRLRQQISDAQKQIDARLAAQREYARKQEGLASMNEPELMFWESHLGVRIEGGGGVDRLRVVFWLLGSNGNGNSNGNNSSTSTSSSTLETGNRRKTITSGTTSVSANAAEPGQEGEAFFDLSTATRDYQVTKTQPRLNRERVDEVVEKLNSTRDFGAFLRGMRGLFVENLRRR